MSAPSVVCVGSIGSRPISVLELACGGGDIAIDLDRMGRRSGLALAISACDLNPEAIRLARANALRRGGQVQFSVADALAEPGQEKVDVVYCTLFAHHLTDDAVETLLRVMAARARRLVIVDDLIRSRLGYALAWSGTVASLLVLAVGLVLLRPLPVPELPEPSSAEEPAAASKQSIADESATGSSPSVP